MVLRPTSGAPWRIITNYENEVHHSQCTPAFPILLPTHPYHSAAISLNPLLFLHHTSRPPISSSLELTGRSFNYIAPLLWNNLPPCMRQPSPKPSSQTHAQPCCTKQQPLALSKTLLHSALKTLLFNRSHPSHAPIKLHKPDHKTHPPEQLGKECTYGTLH
jgi:hypothetical protein